jgi:hypothetical protein
MAGSKTLNKNRGTKSMARDRFLKGTDTPVLRLKSYNGGRGVFVWAVKKGEGFQHVPVGDTELR